jgi:hypothetical protein
MRVVHSLSTGAAEMSRFQWSSLGKTVQFPTLGPPAGFPPEPLVPAQLAEQLPLAPPIGALPPDGALAAPPPAPPELVPPLETAPLPAAPLAPAIPATAPKPAVPAPPPGSALGRSEQPLVKATSATTAARHETGIEAIFQRAARPVKVALLPTLAPEFRSYA